MAKYVDGFIIAVPKKNVAAYVKIAKVCARIWKKYGALEYVEALADDVKKGKITSFPRSVKMKPSETVFFSYVVYKSKAQRDSILKKVMKDKAMQKFMAGSMPFDTKRMIYGGFVQKVKL